MIKKPDLHNLESIEHKSTALAVSYVLIACLSVFFFVWLHRDSSIATTGA